MAHGASFHWCSPSDQAAIQQGLEHHSTLCLSQINLRTGVISPNRLHNEKISSVLVTFLLYLIHPITGELLRASSENMSL